MAERALKIGLIGTGGRGAGAAENAMRAAPGVTVVALADVFDDQVAWCRRHLKAQLGHEIADQNCFVGFGAYRKLLEVELDYVILATPPYYRPEHLEACIAAGRHVFAEKPAAVDAPGVRRVVAAGEEAARKGLSIVAGTQRRHQKGYIETIKRLHDGAIGRILGGECYWNQAQLWNEQWFLEKKPGWSDMDWMIRDWFRWRWLSGDHVVEQHVHNIDVINWAIGAHPEKVVAMGARHQRLTGDQYDYFCADFTYPGEVHVISQCRQINHCTQQVAERVVGEKGSSNCNGSISTIGQIDTEGPDPYVQEHANLIAAIRSDKPLNEARTVAESTLSGIMVRQSAYTGKEVTWDEAMKSEEQLGPPDYEITPANIKAHLPIPGTMQG